MDALWLPLALLGLLYLVTPVIAIIALAKANDLARRLQAIEERWGIAPQPAVSPDRPHASPFAPAAPPLAPDTPAEPAAIPPLPEPAAAAPPPEPPPAPPIPALPQGAGAGEVGGTGVGDLEQAFGTRWVVWIGGLALALGGVFLVRYSIEAGLIGPGLRVTFGALFAVALALAGERLRRVDRSAGFIGIPAAYVPGMLTAAGTATAYATVWSAYELYGFLPPAVAFLLLGAVAVAAIVAALLHGPALAALGTLAAYATPILTATPDPSAYGLFMFLAAVTGAAYAVARARLWRWLAVSATVLVTLWGFGYVFNPVGAETGPLALHAALQLGLIAALIVPGLAFGPPAVARRLDGLSALALAAVAATMAFHALDVSMSTGSLVLVGAATVAVLAIAWLAEATTLAVPLSAAFAVLVTVSWAIEPNLATTVAPAGATAAPEPLPVLIEPMVAFAAGIAALVLAVGVAAVPRRRRGVVALIWAGSAAVVPLAMLAACYWHIAAFLPSPLFAALGLALAALHGALAEKLLRGRASAGARAAASVFATACLAALALGLTMILERGWLTVALALVALAAAYIAAQRPYPFMRWVAAAFVALLAGRIAWDPAIMGEDVGSTPVLNWLLWGYGVPAAALALGARELRRHRDDIPARLFEGTAILFAYLLVTFQIRHALHDGDIYAPEIGLVEAGVQVGAWALMAAGLERFAAVTENQLRAVAAAVISVVAVGGAWITLGLTENPLINVVEVGTSLVLNPLLPGYAVPAIAFAALHVASRGRRPEPWRKALATTAFAAAFAYVNCEVALAFRGPMIALGHTPAISDAEWYTYSAVWLVAGLALLVAGLMRGSRGARIASAGLITLTVLKVFLSDMADLEGMLRALSFIGLGVVLVGIGWLYQRLLARRAPQTETGPG